MQHVQEHDGGDLRPVSDAEKSGMKTVDEKAVDETAVFPSPTDDEDSSDETAPSLPALPWYFKWIALLCVVSMPIGDTWTDAALSPLKSTLRRELKITNTQFGVISSADAFVNTIFPIAGGLVMDWWGPNIITMCCTSIVLIGAVVSAVGVQIGLWRVIVAGRVIMGIGIPVLDSATQKFYYHWFGPAHYAFVFGLDNAIGSTVSLVSGLTAVPIRDSTGWYGWSFWIPVFFCAFSLLMNAVYILFEKVAVPRSHRLTPGRAKAIQDKFQQKKRFKWNVLTQLPWAFLMLPATQLLQSGAAGGFSTSSADIIYKKGYTEAVAGYISSAQKILPIVLSPAVGLAIDRWGHRFHYITAAPILWIIACALLGFTDEHPTVALVFSSLAGVINAMPLQICFPLLIADQTKLGTAFGLWRAFNNSGSTIMDVVFGVIQDDTPGQGYSRVLLFEIGMKAWAFVLGLSYIFVDWKWLGSGLTMTRRQREKRIAQIEDKDADPLTRRTVKPWFTALTFGLLLGIVVSAWVVFLKYLIV